MHKKCIITDKTKIKFIIIGKDERKIAEIFRKIRKIVDFETFKERLYFNSVGKEEYQK